MQLLGWNSISIPFFFFFLTLRVSDMQRAMVAVVFTQIHHPPLQLFASVCHLIFLPPLEGLDLSGLLLCHPSLFRPSLLWSHLAQIWLWHWHRALSLAETSCSQQSSTVRHLIPGKPMSSASVERSWILVCTGCNNPCKQIWWADLNPAIPEWSQNHSINKLGASLRMWALILPIKDASNIFLFPFTILISLPVTAFSVSPLSHLQPHNTAFLCFSFPHHLCIPLHSWRRRVFVGLINFLWMGFSPMLSAHPSPFQQQWLKLSVLRAFLCPDVCEHPQD